MKRKIGWAEALTHALECEGMVNIDDLAAAIAPGPAQREAIEALAAAAKEAILDGAAVLDPEALEHGTVVLVAT